MNWIALVAGLALATVLLALVTDVEMTSCRPSSFYAIVRLCSAIIPTGK